MIEPRYTFTKTYDHTLRHKQETNLQHVDFGDASENDVLNRNYEQTERTEWHGGRIVLYFLANYEL